ncbi:hypothetical protein GCM10027289_15850 [Tsukamurella serpentis]
MTVPDSPLLSLTSASTTDAKSATTAGWRAGSRSVTVSDMGYLRGSDLSNGTCGTELIRRHDRTVVPDVRIRVHRATVLHRIGNDADPVFVRFVTVF